MSLLNELRALLPQFAANKTCWIAYSGGLDSHVLLSLCHQLRTEINFDFRAIHINHHISPHADSWGLHCQKICDQYQIELFQSDVQLNLKPGDSLEETARDKRYAIFTEYMQQDDILLTAHHQDDQAETVLLQLLRGAGPKGLSAMPRLKKFGRGYLARPLLGFSRNELEIYARENNLTWIEDESNQDVTLSRNFIRHEIMPRLITAWPSASASIARSAAHCAENQDLLEEYLQDDYRAATGSDENTLSVAKLLQMKPEKQKLILRRFIYQNNFSLPNSRKIESILQDVLHSAWDKSPCVKWDDAMLRRHKDDIHLLSAEVEPDLATVEWEIEKPLELTHGVLKTRLISGAGLRADIKQVAVGFRQGGEMVEVKGRGRQSLKNLFQEWGVLPWERSSLPLVFVGQQLIAIAGYFLHADFVAGEGEEGREIIFERSRSKQEKILFYGASRPSTS